MLGNWPTHRFWHPESIFVESNGMGLPHPVCDPMDMACSDLYCVLVRTGIVSYKTHILATSLTYVRPWWLVRHGKLEEARASIVRLTSKKQTSANVEDTLAMMIHTNELEIQQTTGTSYLDCFKGVDLRRTELTVMTWVIQQTSGSQMFGWSTYFLLQVGLSGDSAYSLNIGQSAMGFAGTVGSWVCHRCLEPLFFAHMLASSD